MHIRVCTTDGAELDIEDFDQGSFLELLESWAQDDVRLLTFALNDGLAYIPKAAVTRIDTFD